MSRPGRYSKGERKRDEILDAAIAVFAERGYDRTSVREIARAADLSQAGLLHYFQNKEELFAEVLRRRDLRNKSHHTGGRSGLATAAGLVEVVRSNEDEPELVRLFVALSAESTADDSPARAFFADRYRTLRQGIADDVRSRQERGDFAPGLDPDTVASLLIAAADGLQIQWLLDPESVDMGAQLQRMLDALTKLPTP